MVEHSTQIKSNKMEVQPGDILFGKLNPLSVWKVHYVNFQDEHKPVASTEFIPLKTNSKHSQEFLYQLLHSEGIKRSVGGLITGSTGSHKRVSPGYFLRQWVVVPKALEEQRRIATFLRAIDDRIILVDRQLAGGEAFKRGLLQQMFV